MMYGSGCISHLYHNNQYNSCRPMYITVMFSFLYFLYVTITFSYSKLIDYLIFRRYASHKIKSKE